jgi:hypothetical protein
LPTDVEFLGTIANGFDGMVTPLVEVPRTMSPGNGPIEGLKQQEFFCPRYATNSFNNMLVLMVAGTRRRGFFWPGSVSDSTMIRENPFWVAMKLDNENVPNQDWAPNFVPRRAAVIVDSGF